MDLERFIANRELLERLSREYELLKASGADVDYAAWVRQRLREAAADLAAATVGVATSSGGKQHGTRDSRGVHAVGAAPSSADEQTTRAEGETTRPLMTPSAEQLGFTRRPGSAAYGLVPRPPLEAAAASHARPETAWFLRGEGAGPASEVLATAIYGPSAPGAAGLPAPALPPAAAKASRKPKRVVILSPRKSPLPTQPRPSPTQRAAPAPPASKLYTRVEPGLFSSRPDAYVHPQARERREPQAVTRPDWVNAASLQAALRGASSAVPHLQAAAERERRLAISTALARQTLAAGLGADEARAVALYGVSPAAVTAQAAQYDHVLLVAQQLAQQNEQLAMAVQLNSAQLVQQQALLESALHPQQQHAIEGAGAAGAPVPAPPARGARVEVESGPPPWFLRRAPGPATASGRGGLSGKLGRGTTTTTKSPRKAGTRSRSPPPHMATLLTMAKPSAAAAGPARVTAAAMPTTAKERDRSTRREALKTLLRQVLGGAGLAGGREGRRRLASSMAEAEKLVVAIQALARHKAGKDGAAGDDEILPASKAALMAESQTQTSGRASGSGGGAVEAVAAPAGAAAGVQATESRPPSRAASVAPLRCAASAAGAGCRALSRQGSGRLASGSADSDPQSAPAEAPGDAPRRAASPAESSGASEGWGAGPSKRASGKSLSPPGSAKGTTAASSPASPQEPSGGTASVAVPEAEQRGRAAPPADGSAAAAVAAAGGSRPGAAAPGHAQAQAVAATGALRGAPPGLLVESLEDQVQQIVERDAAAAAEMVRFQKLDALEQRLHSMVDKVETKLARVLQPLQLNAQQQQQQQQQAGLQGLSGWELRLGPDGQPMRGLQPVASAADAAATGEPSIAALAAAIVAATAAGAGAATGGAPGATGAAGGRGGSGGGGGSAAGVDVVSPRSAGLSVLELQRMLIQLNRMESTEQEVRRKWFYDAKGARQRGRVVGQPIMVRDGQLGTLDRDDPTPPPPYSPPSPSPGDRAAASPPRRAAFWSLPQPPTESALATVAADSMRSALSGPGPGRLGALAGPGDASSVQAQDGTAAADQALSDPVSDATLESVLRGRRRFLRAQKLADGDLVAAAEPSLNPVQIMEDLTDALLDEVLQEQAQEMVGLCDSLGEHMLKDELDLSDDDDDGGGGRKR